MSLLKILCLIVQSCSKPFDNYPHDYFGIGEAVNYPYNSYVYSKLGMLINLPSFPAKIIFHGIQSIILAFEAAPEVPYPRLKNVFTPSTVSFPQSINNLYNLYA